MNNDDSEGALKSEALARDKWRGDGGTFLDDKDAAGHTLPESERDRASQESTTSGPEPLAGTMLPPD